MRFDRQWHGRFARLGVVLAVAVATGVAATPALANPNGPPNLFASLDDVTIGADGATGKAFPMWVEGANAVAPKVTIDFTNLAKVASITFPDG
jgi:hypothetical protein